MDKVTMGFDCGNGIAKLATSLSGTVATCPSFYLVCPNDKQDAVVYLNGPQSELIGTGWLIGKAAYSHNPTYSFRISDDDGGKVAYGLQFLLGLLITQNIQTKTEINLVASIHDAELFGPQYVQRLKGKHVVKCCGQTYTITVNVSAINEGVGAIAYAHSKKLLDFNSQTSLIDIGHGTVIVGAYFKGQTVDSSRRVLNSGVDLLITDISRHLTVRQELMREGDKELIRRGILDKSFKYGNRSFNFEVAYRECVKDWVASNLVTATKSLSQWSDSSKVKLAIGGGSKLPLVEQLLSKNGYMTLPDGHLANVKGLELLARKL